MILLYYYFGVKLSTKCLRFWNVVNDDIIKNLLNVWLSTCAYKDNNKLLRALKFCRETKINFFKEFLCTF